MRKMIQINLWILLLIYIVCGIPTYARIFRGIAMFSSVGARAPSARKFKGGDGTRSMSYDEFGHIPDLEEAQLAVDQARSVIAMRQSNSSVIAYVEDNSSNHILSTPVGISTVNLICKSNSDIYLVLTGLSADSRFLLRAAKKRAVDYSFMFDKPISARLLSQYLGNIIRENYMNNNRPLVSHMFVIGDRTIWEIDCTGLVQEIVAGAAGLGRSRALEVLETRYNTSLNTEDLSKMIHEAYQNHLDPSQSIRFVDIKDPKEK